MRNKENKHLGIETDKELHYVAKFEGRSGNGQILYMIKEYIKNFEK